MEKFLPKTEHSPEKQAENFKNRLDNIFNTQLTTENIHDFADDAMNKLIKLIDEVKSAYQKENSEQLTGKELEDKAFEHYNLHGIINLLDKIQEKSKQIEGIYQYIKEIPQIDEVITPPDKLDLTKTTNGDIPWERKKIIPRLATLLYILETDFNIPKEEVNIIEGIVSNEQMRTEPYYRVEIDELNRLIYVCIEAENVTYIFDQEKLKENRIEVELMDILTKQERNDALEQYPNLGTKLKQSKYWRENISELLTADKLEYKNTNTIEKETNNTENIPKVSTSEFDEWRGFWTDEEGKHWGTVFILYKKTKIDRSIIYKTIQTLQHKPIKSQGNRHSRAYCYQDFIHIPEIEKILQQKQFQKEEEIPQISLIKNIDLNQLPGFWTDKDGNHWGPRKSLERATALGSKTIIKYTNGLPSKDIKTQDGKVRQSYCYEKLIENEEIIQILKKKKEEKELKIITPETNGYWTDINGNNWGTNKTIANSMGIDSKNLKKYLRDLPSIPMKTLNNNIRPSYCYQEVIQIPEIQELLRKKKPQEEKQEG